MLRLDANDIDDVGTEDIRLAIPENTALQQLSLVRNGISEEKQAALEALNTSSRTINFSRLRKNKQHWKLLILPVEQLIFLDSR